MRRVVEQASRSVAGARVGRLAAFAVSCGVLVSGAQAMGRPSEREATTRSHAAAGQIVQVQAAAKPTQFGELRFRQRRLAARAGRVTFSFRNPASLEHNFAVRRGGRKLGVTRTISNGRSARLTLRLKAGRYTFYCAVPGHEASGMKGPLVVSRG